MKIQNPKLLAISILICQGAGVFGSFFTAPSVKTWYTTLNKPSFNPPNWLFAPVWTTLFLLMGVALYLVWQKSKRNKEVKKVLKIFWLHLALNIAWSFLFFGLKNPLAGLIGIIFLWGMIAYLIIAFKRINKWSGWLLFPYFLWVTFAAFLNFSIWQLN